MNDSSPKCIYCGISSDQVPLVSLLYQGTDYWICPQHLPILIHHPENLKEKFPGMETINPRNDPTASQS
jgi:hypothetical protein